MFSHVDPTVNNEFGEWAQSKYGEVKDVEINRVKKHAFLGMALDFGDARVYHVLQEEHVNDIVSSWPEKFKDTNMILTPTSINLFEKGGGRLLNAEKKETFHSVVAKALFVCHQS